MQVSWCCVTSDNTLYMYTWVVCWYFACNLMACICNVYIFYTWKYLHNQVASCLCSVLLYESFRFYNSELFELAFWNYWRTLGVWVYNYDDVHNCFFVRLEQVGVFYVHNEAGILVVRQSAIKIIRSIFDKKLKAKSYMESHYETRVLNVDVNLIYCSASTYIFLKLSTMTVIWIIIRQYM